MKRFVSMLALSAVLFIAFALAIPTPAKACNVGAQFSLQSAVSCPQIVAPAFVPFAAVESCPSVGFSAQTYGVQSFAAQSFGVVANPYGVGVRTFAVERRARFRNRIGRGVRALGRRALLGRRLRARGPRR